MAQPISQAYKYQFVLEFSDEQSKIREIDDSVGTRPKFVTFGELPVGKLNKSYTADIVYGGGNGTLVATVLGTKTLPNGISISYLTNKVRLSGTPTQFGTWRILVRILDADKDPAYSVFTLQILPAPKNILIAQDDFGNAARALHLASNGFGFSSAWDEQDGFSFTQISTSSPLTYPGLYCSKGGYIDGKSTQYKTHGRQLDKNTFDYLAKSNNLSVLGQTGASLWISHLIRREAIASSKFYFLLNNGFNAVDPKTQKVQFGVSSAGKWALNVRNGASDGWIMKESSIAANTGSTNLIVTEIRFGLVNDTIRVFVNPTSLGGNAPNNPAITYITTFTGDGSAHSNQDLEFSQIGFYGNSATQAYQVDDIRLGDTYKAVTPTTAPAKIDADAGLEALENTLESMVAYPNPSSGSVSLYSTLKDPVEATLYNSFGLSIQSMEIVSGHNSLDLTPYPTGIYILRYTDKGIFKTIKLMKQ